MSTLHRTPLYTLWQQRGAKFVPFAGYEMPVQFDMGIKREHEHTRSQCGLFDVSHMGQMLIRGSRPAHALERVSPIDAVGIAPGRQRYGLFTSSTGGIHDDFMAVNAGDHLYLVVNAACRASDAALLRSGLGEEGELEVIEDRALLALQGPMAREVMRRLCPEAADLTFMQHGRFDVMGHELWISCSGYTGEDGFELSIPAQGAMAIAEWLLDQEEVAPIGLGARDSLRLEAGLCLYGHDMDKETTPVEASLGWAIGKARRRGGEREGGFPGADVILTQQNDQDTECVRAGLKANGRAPVREGAKLYDMKGDPVGEVTSGTFGPSVGAPVAMGYIKREYHELGQTLQAEVRGRRLDMTITPMPFVTPRHYRG
ncbi:aminomethyltransferase [Kushneria pakistanensis]|uniref:aminomethyltransferase n=1 Tax=Kushneria pakistanensis TaxID=1508770 RepID=A0ABQ3FE86_9GAMM|nr:glycine cleavage system aminomethyltransferase GcvT [Kushneria pakistanensis]GHC20527.1 aminomethyltransferase [Kushneria pakistanensis]